MTALTRIRDDLFQTRRDSPFPGLTTHAYLWRGPAGNLLFYNPATAAQFDVFDELGGIAAQYLSHLDEAGPTLASLAERFGRRLHAPAAEAEEIGRHGHIDVAIPAVRHVDDNGVEVLPTPGHSPGSVSFHWNDHLFSGDVLFRMSVGRTDLRGGSSRELYESIHSVLFKFPDDTTVCPGHGPATTIGFEKKHNPYV